MAGNPDKARLVLQLQKLCAIVSTNPARAVRMAKRIIRYLRMSVDTGIFMSNRAELARALALQETSLMAHYDPDTVLAYSDASFAPIAADCKTFEGARSHQGIILTIAMVPM